MGAKAHKAGGFNGSLPPAEVLCLLWDVEIRWPQPLPFLLSFHGRVDSGMLASNQTVPH